MDDYSQFYSETKGRLFAFLRRMTGDDALAIDLVQESFLRYLHRYRIRGCSKSLLYAIARNATLDALRERKQTESATQHCDDSGCTPEDQMTEREAFDRMLPAIARLPALERDVIALVADGELSYREIGNILKVRESTVKAHPPSPHKTEGDAFF